MRFFLLTFGMLSVCFLAGCGDSSDVPEDLRASPNTPMTPETALPNTPRGAMAAEPI